MGRGVVTELSPWGGMSQTTKPDKRFHAYEVAREIVRAVAPMIGQIARRDPDLAKQIRKALPSIPMNIAEGRRRSGRDRIYHYDVAAGSADEVSTALDSAEAMGYLGRSSNLDEAQLLLDRDLAMLWRLTH